LTQTEKKISSNLVYEGKILKLKVDQVMLPNSQKASREVVEHAQGVAVAALDEDRNVFLVSQYRYPAAKEILEIPAGLLEEGEEPLAGAQRELREETGIEARDWLYLFSIYSSPGFTDELIHLFMARNIHFSAQELDEDEFIKIIKIPLDHAVEAIKKGEICDAKSVACLLGVKLYI
jgi:ADP-ribose pyrophosphatase